jgi:Outer membrane protein beta-barrel domain
MTPQLRSTYRNLTIRIPFNLMLLAGLLIPSLAQAGFIELSATGNYRISRIDEDNYQEMVSYTGSVSYYFWELSALELSYTEGIQVVVLKIPGDNKTTTSTKFSLAGLDLVLTLADKQSAFQPYIKVGGAYLTKRIEREVEGIPNGNDSIDAPSGAVPSAGLGFKVKLTNQMSIKVGVDAWTSPLDRDPVTIDYAGRAGMSWLF